MTMGDFLRHAAIAIHAASITRNGEADSEISVRWAAQLLREVERREQLFGEAADYYDGIIPREEGNPWASGDGVAREEETKRGRTRSPRYQRPPDYGEQ